MLGRHSPSSLRSRASAIALFVALLAHAPQARGDAPAPDVVLDYDVRLEDARCLSAEAFRAAVSERLGDDPFVATAETTLVVRLESMDDGRIRAVLTLQGGSAATQGTQHVEAERDECEMLGRAASLAATLALVRYRAERAALRPETPPTGPMFATPPPPPTSKVERLRLGAEAQLGAALGLVPGVVPGAGVGARAFWKRLSLGLAGELWLPGRTDDSGRATARVTMRAGTFVPCIQVRELFVCATVAFGSLRSDGPGGGFESPYVALGPRLATTFWARRSLSLGVFLEGRVPLVRTQVNSNGERLWLSPPAAALAGVAFGFRLF